MVLSTSYSCLWFIFTFGLYIPPAKPRAPWRLEVSLFRAQYLGQWLAPRKNSVTMPWTRSHKRTTPGSRFKPHPGVSVSVPPSRLRSLGDLCLMLLNATSLPVLQHPEQVLTQGRMPVNSKWPPKSVLLNPSQNPKALEHTQSTRSLWEN